jgi:hypothetical protein
MKTGKIYILCIFLFFGILFWVKYHLPKRFVWTPTFYHSSPQPFGCKVFDEVVTASYPEEYSVSRETFYQFAEDSSACRAFLLVEENLRLTPTDVNVILKIAERGNKLMLVSSHFSSYLSDTLRFAVHYDGYLTAKGLKAYASSFQSRERLCWVDDSEAYNYREFDFYPHLFSTSFMLKDSLSDVLYQPAIK